MKILIALAAMILASCAQVDKVIDFTEDASVKAMSRAVPLECARSMADRQALYARYRVEQDRVSPDQRMMPFDCDGDERPDF